MATKRRELLGLPDEDIDAIGGAAPVPPGCFGKADLDEPLFVLRGNDRCAPGTVRDWARRATGAGCPSAKIDEAMDIAREMEAWQQAHSDRAKWPD